jgi:hypothetical protein
MSRINEAWNDAISMQEARSIATAGSGENEIKVDMGVCFGNGGSCSHYV